MQQVSKIMADKAGCPGRLGFKMKKISLILICLLFLTKAYSQSLSAKELVNLTDKYSKEDFLKSRSFTSSGSSIGEKGVSEHFAKNSGTAKQETVFTIGNTITYLTRSKVFITNLLTQLQRQFKQTAKDEGKDFTYYQFTGGDGRTVSVNFSKSSDNYHSVVVMQK
jgi:hypothetical protein